MKVILTIIKWIALASVALALIVTAAIFVLPKPPLLQNISFSQEVYADHHELLRLTLARDQQYRVFTPLTFIPKTLIDATLLQEDQYFYHHYGVNPVSLFRAVWQTYAVKQRKMGASTITMQVARIRFHLNSKTISGKLEQIFRAWQLERYYSKNQILEVYLNLASYGSNIEGVGAASLIYFGTPVQHLNLPEVLTLSVIPQNPLKRGANLNSNQQLKIARDKLFVRWLKIHPEDADKLQLMQLPLHLKNVHNLPFLAPHFVNNILQKNPKATTLNTSLNLNLQKILEHVGQNYIKKNQTSGISNFAAMLIDTRTMQVKTSIGSSSFFDKSIAGQVNGTQAKRSPGSTLKPFIYALAMQQGLIHPMTVLKDTPSNFGGYNPENFDKDFAGPIKAKDALVSSRNIPAIDLANQLHNPNFYEFLQQANISDLKPQSHYGLSLVLGGAEVTMEELVTMYAMLANHGILKPLHHLQNQQSNQGKRLLSAEASFLVMEILQENPSPQPVYMAAGAKKIPVYWKTGTSSGYRDAWAIGIFGHYVLAVWVGDFTNKKPVRYVGNEIASPLFFEFIHAIVTQQHNFPRAEHSPRGMNLVQVDVCEASGLLPTPSCPKTVKTWFIPGVSPIKKDTVYREILINRKTGLRACQYNKDTEFQVYEFWPSDLLKIFEQAGIARRTPPPYGPECGLEARASEGQAPKIISPLNNVVYNIRLAQAESTTVSFSATADAGVKQLYWFLNNNYIGDSAPNEALYWPATPGKFIVRVIDDQGRSETRQIEINTIQ